MSHDSRLSRRELLKRAGLAGTAAVVPAPLASAASPAAEPAPVRAQVPVVPARREAFETLSAAESETLEAVVARLVPTDALGPGAAEARAAHYIDRALAGPLAGSRAAYTAGLAALDAYTQTSKGAPFARLAPADQDAVLSGLEKNAPSTGAEPAGTDFFALVRAHVIEGMFADPYYGGNAEYIGWDLIRYPGVRVLVNAAEQQRDPVAPNHHSAYDFTMFAKPQPAKPGARTRPPEEHERGD